MTPGIQPHQHNLLDQLLAHPLAIHLVKALMKLYIGRTGSCKDVCV